MRHTAKSIHNDIWSDIVDYDKGTIMKVFMKNNNVIYLGYLGIHEENGNDSWFVLTDYKCIYSNETEFDSRDSSNMTTVAIPLREVERIELFYDNNTKIFD